MRLHYLQHVPFEDAGNIASWARQRGHALTCTRLDLGEALPPQVDFDCLAVMGGPMNVYEQDLHPWLVREKEFLRRSIDRGVPVLGVCLGAQLAADVLGARVTRNPCKEIGWFPVWRTEESARSPIFGKLPERFLSFHWHGDTFSIPPGATSIARSEACVNQAFEWRRVVGLQFHLDYSAASIEQMLRHCAAELDDGPSVQNPEEMLGHPDRVEDARRLLFQLLDAMTER